MGFRKKTIKIDVLGQKWRVTFHEPAHYVKKVADDSKALIDDDLRTLDVDIKHLSHEIIAHELTHAYAKERSLTETQLSAEQMEDFFCEIVGKHGRTLLKQADNIVKVGKGIKWK